MVTASRALPGSVLHSAPAAMTASNARLWRLPWLVPVVTACAAGALYVQEASPSVGGGNSGEFQVMAHLLGIAHPPSYPLYLLLAKAFSLLPLPGDVAWRINVLTALLGAVCVLLAGLIPLALAREPRAPAVLLASALAAAATSAMPRLWTLALEAEVFTLHLALVLALWLVLLRWTRAETQAGAGSVHAGRAQAQAQADRWLLAAGLLAGLGLANHRTFLFSAAGGALYVLLLRPGVVRRWHVVAGVAVMTGLGLMPYLYVLRAYAVPVAYFSPDEVRRLGRADLWYVLQGNAAAETGGGEVVRQLFRDPALLAQRTRWLLGHLVSQLGVAGGPLLAVSVTGLALLVRRAARWSLTCLAGAGGAAVFAMSYAKYPDADRYLLPLETLLVLGLATAVSTACAGLSRVVSRWRGLTRLLGGLAGAGLAGYWAVSMVGLTGATDFTRGGYVHHTIHNLQGVERGAVVCSWWASSWGWWYAQHVDGVRRDVLLIPKGPDDCLRDVLPQEAGRRPVYFPALTERMRQSEHVFFPSRDMWLPVGRRVELTVGALLKGPDERIFLFDGSQRRWVPSLDVFAARGYSWESVRLTPDYVLKDVPEGPPLSSAP